MRTPIRAALAAALIALTAPAAVHAQAVPGSVNVDAVMSPNVQYFGSLKADGGLTTGARILHVGDKDRLYVTSGKNVSIYDITGPNVVNPQLLGIVPNVIWENEEVATDGKVLVFASDWYSFMPDCMHGPLGGCVQFFDVRDPASPKLIATIDETNHTAECAAPKEDDTQDCEYVYGSYGTIIDARGATTGTEPKVIGDWINALKPQGVNEADCHHIRQISPGVLLTACRPFTVISINAEDGGSPALPKVLSLGIQNEFVHSARWPRGGTDKILLTGGEENFTARCENNTSDFITWNAEQVLNGQSNKFTKLDSVEPAGNGVYADGKPVAGALGCSVHWFQEHPTFHNGGLVALSQYEDGVRFEQVKPNGKIEEVGYFLAAGSSSSSPKWAPDGKTVYSIDYQRGIDILRYNGGTFEPGPDGKVRYKHGQVRGKWGQASALRAMRKLRRVSQAKMVRQLRANGWFPGYCRLAAQRGNSLH